MYLGSPFKGLPSSPPPVPGVSLTVCNQSFVNSDEVTRDYSPHVKEPLMRECCLLPWFPEKLTDKEWIDKLSDETTLEFVRKELSAMQMKVCSF